MIVKFSYPLPEANRTVCRQTKQPSRNQIHPTPLHSYFISRENTKMPMGYKLGQDTKWQLREVGNDLIWGKKKRISPCLIPEQYSTLSIFSNMILLTSETWAFTFISFSISSAWSMIYFMCSFIIGLQIYTQIINLSIQFVYQALSYQQIIKSLEQNEYTQTPCSDFWQ